MTTTTDKNDTLNDMADAYAVLDPTAERSDHLGVLLIACDKLGIPTDLDTPLTDGQAAALDEEWTDAGR
jgi:hypothetical protein